MRPASFGATVIAADPAAVAAFYTRHFDVEVTVDLGWFITLRRGESEWELAILELGHSSVPAGAAEREGGGAYGFVVDDVDAVARSLVEAGVRLEGEVVDEPWGQRHFFVRDPAGTYLDVISLTEPDPEWLKANLP